MHNLGSSTADEWRALVRTVHDRADGLVDEFLTQVDDLPTYSRGAVPRDRLESDAVASFEFLLRQLGDLPVPARLHEVGPAIGRDRARRGVPLDHLLTAVRLDFRVLWHSLRASAGPEHTTLLVERAEDVWSAVEEYTTTVQVSYLEEAARMSREQSREQAALVRTLLARAEPDSQDVSRVALALDVDPEAPFLVAAAPSNADKELRTAADQLTGAGRRLHVDETAQHTTLIVRWHSDSADAADALLGGARCGLAPLASGLVEVPRAVRIAKEIVEVLPGHSGGAHDLRSAWMLLVGARLGELAPPLARSVLGGLEEVPEGERERLVTTALSFARTGSAQRCAEELYCHRNTVMNRLHRLTELTGLDMTRPHDASLVLVTATWGR